MLIHKDGIRWLQLEIDKFQLLLEEYHMYESINSESTWSGESKQFVTNFQNKLNQYNIDNAISKSLQKQKNQNANNTNFLVLLNEFTKNVCYHITNEDQFRNFIRLFCLDDPEDTSEILRSKAQIRTELHELNANFYNLHSCIQDAMLMNRSLNRAVNLSKDYHDIGKFASQISLMKKLVNNIESSSKVIGMEINTVSKLKPVDRNIVPKPELPDYNSSWVYSNVLSWI